MSAMKGYGTPRRMLLACCVAIIAAVLVPAVASARPARKAEEGGGAPATSAYLALGDSISFGYTEERFDTHYPNDAPTFFEEGVANDFLKDLRKTDGKQVQLVNDACPGETSNGLIGEDEELGGKASTESIEEVEGYKEGKPNPETPEGGYQGLGDWHPCKYSFVDRLPLHNGGYVNGGKEVSQLEEAVSLLTADDPYTGKPEEVKAVTLNIGSNDELAAIKQCEDEVAVEYGTKGKSKYGETPTAAAEGCIAETAQHVTIPHIINNLGDILGVLEHYYSGPIILVGFYNPDAKVLAGSDLLQKGANEAVEKDLLPLYKDVTFANPFPVFNKGYNNYKNTEQEQESICKYTEMCNPNVQVKGGSPEGKDGDIHPTLVGYKELAKLINVAFEANPAK
jgi:lysophospholipase L1-like esterase